ncbi:hypothetical protein [Pseudothioclava nitratireducens]|jgi:hypothetical protein|uniref:hypothetical protein n=1 Tax=Pseudothioclava nitratireducens TaxID=1928646 RepID=UPI0023D9B820|nr:hypothetical protein [Defluviimonas nitratireducens]MDF1621135.1 hypothetical protein [Defluviimonas nitratireducens]
MKTISKLALLGAALGLAACDGVSIDKTFDRGTDRKHLSQLQAGVWIDPEGCDHWIIDDGVEGYLTARVDDYGRPICSGAGPASTAVGPYKSGSAVRDPL